MATEMTTVSSTVGAVSPATLVKTRSARPDGRRVPGAFAFDVAIVGLGYVGLPTALQFHSAGRRVLGLDISTRRLADISDRNVDLLGSDHKRLTEALRDDGLLLTAATERLRDSAAAILFVPTPIDRHLNPDLTALTAACRSVVEAAQPGQTIILTSTTYVGCTKKLLVEPLKDRG